MKMSEDRGETILVSSLEIYQMGSCYVGFFSLILIDLPLEKMVVISQTIFTDAFSWTKFLYFD